MWNFRYYFSIKKELLINLEPKKFLEQYKHIIIPILIFNNDKQTLDFISNLLQYKNVSKLIKLFFFKKKNYNIEYRENFSKIFSWIYPLHFVKKSLMYEKNMDNFLYQIVNEKSLKK